MLLKLKGIKTMKVYKKKSDKVKIIDSYNRLLKSWNVEVEEVDVPTSYGTTHVNICGSKDGYPLVLFHGVGDDAALMWVYNMQALAKVFRVYAVDTIGGPGKSVPDENYNQEFDDIKWIDEMLDYLDLQTVNIAGVSNGSYLTQYYTANRINRINKALCLAGGVAVSTGKSSIMAMLKIFLPEALFPTKKNIKKLIEKMCGTNSAAFTDNGLLMEHFTYVMKGFNKAAMRFHKVKGLTDEQVELIRGKCKYFLGESDPFVLLGGKELNTKYKMNTVFFPEVGHAINHEIADKINTLMIEYFCI